MPEDRSDEQATTKVFPYPIPSPERDKVEEMTCYECATPLHGPYCPKCNPLAEELADALIRAHASEKRAATLEREIVLLRKQLHEAGNLA